MSDVDRDELMKNLLTVSHLSHQQVYSLAWPVYSLACPVQDVCRDARKCIEQLESENARLRKAIEHAPHENSCDCMHPCKRNTVCDCWKSKALGEKEGK